MIDVCAANSSEFQGTNVKILTCAIIIGKEKASKAIKGAGYEKFL